MSFSKARIQRFNELGNDVPPPGAYDPKLDTKVKGIVIEKSERFNDSRSVGSADCNLSTVCSKSTCTAVVNFRTPQLPKKTCRDQKKSTGKVKRSLITSTDPKLKYKSEHECADLQVECFNKDKTIQEQEKHMEDIKEEVRRLKEQLEELHKKQAEVEQQHRKDIETMAKLQQEILNDHDEKHQAEVARLRNQLLEATEEREKEIAAANTTVEELNNRLADCTKRINILELELGGKESTYLEKIASLEAQNEELKTELETVTASHNNEIRLHEEEKIKFTSCIDELSDERNRLTAKLEKRREVIFELQAQLSALQCELHEFRAEYEKLVETSSKRLDDLVSKHQLEVERLKSDYEEEIITLQNENAVEKSRRIENETKVAELGEENNFLKTELQDVQRLYKDVNKRLCEAHRELEDSEKKYNITLDKYQQELTDLTSMKNKEIMKLKEAKDKEIEEETRRIKQHADKMVENAEAVTRETLAACRNECEERVKRVIAESDAKVNAMIKDAKTAVEEEMRLTAERYKACLARVELERAALDEKLAQKDAEITRLSITIEELRTSAETQESFGQSLQMELDRAETELAEKKEELRALKDQIRAEAAEMVARKKRFEVIMAENQASVAALSTCLAQSTAEVERLQLELQRGESSINEHRDLLSIMRNNSQMVHEQVHAIMEQLDAKKGLVDQLEAESLSEVQSMKSLFNAKIDHLKRVADKEIARLKADCDAKAVQNAEITNQLHEMANHLSKVQSMLLQLEERNDAQEYKISQLELANDKAEERARQAALEEKALKNECNKHKTALKDANSKIQELSDKIEQLESEQKAQELEEERNKSSRRMMESFEKAIMEELEAEKSRREAAESEVKRLTKYNERLVKEYQEISEKYAEVVGHQNLRQKIKHVEQMKDKITHLEQVLQAKLKTIEEQQKIIEKFKADERRSLIKGKENILGKSKLTATPTSPHKSFTPLRSRNDKT